MKTRPALRIRERDLPDWIIGVALNVLEHLLDAAPKLILLVEDEFDPLVTPGSFG